MQVRAPGSGETLATTLARLRADPAVAYAEPDYRRHILATPDDPLFHGHQWHLKNDASTPSAIDAIGAWDTTQGGDGIVIAVVDTGVRFDHPDLGRVAAAGRLLDGYDFITDLAICERRRRAPMRTLLTPVIGARASSSSWHGTLVSGIVGAMTNNATGIAGITWNGRILPVRALGKCGGDDSDVISAVLWAAGIPVSGVPDNPDPAKIINLSLGSTGSCPASWQDAISQVVARGVLVVVAAGNESGPVGSPANCQGVAAVAAFAARRHQGRIQQSRPRGCARCAGRQLRQPERCLSVFDRLHVERRRHDAGGQHVHGPDQFQRRHEFFGADRGGHRSAHGSGERSARRCTAHRPAAKRVQAFSEIAGYDRPGLPRSRRWV